jgi:hypothetical protein
LNCFWSNMDNFLTQLQTSPKMWPAFPLQPQEQHYNC